MLSCWSKVSSEFWFWCCNMTWDCNWIRIKLCTSVMLLSMSFHMFHLLIGAVDLIFLSKQKGMDLVGRVYSNLLLNTLGGKESPGGYHLYCLFQIQRSGTVQKFPYSAAEFVIYSFSNRRKAWNDCGVHWKQSNRDGWAQEVASEAVQQQQPGEVPVIQYSLTSHAVTSVLSLMSLEFVFRPPDHDPDIKATLVPLPCPFPLYLIFLRSRTWMLSTDDGTAPWRSSAADHRRWLKSWRECRGELQFVTLL